MTIREEHARPVTLTEQQLEQVTGGRASITFTETGNTTGSDAPRGRTRNPAVTTTTHSEGNGPSH
jgi:hypothetical protein